ncbi:membrane protein insertase YidC [uncultured Desulfovibrio sp.]|uniref:membrane protein insertase YidC n=1 Tax=uncultured Desulfovibrio sp. TaxID=167968 RepID=UPI002605593B|nr:membrane protein insertase YidC [uncultured Desulfovibrio sp.]
MQDSKNLILAIVLCLGILFGWGYLAQYMGWVQQPDPAVVAQQQEAARQEAARAEQRRQEAAQAATLPAFTPAPGRDLTVDSPLYEAVFYTGGGPLRSFKLKKFHSGLAPDSPLVNMVDERTAAVAPLGLVINSQPSWSTGQWSLDGDQQGLRLSAGQEASLRLVGMVDNLRVVRELTFSADSYLIREKIRLINTGEQPRSARVSYTVASDAGNASGGQYDSMRVAWDNDGSLSEESSGKTLESTGVQVTGKIYWAGAMSTYFLAAVLPGDVNNVTVKGLLQKTVYRAAVEEPESMLAPGQEKVLTVSYWLGPKEREQLAAVSDQLARSIDMGMFSFIDKGLLWLLEFFQ